MQYKKVLKIAAKGVATRKIRFIITILLFAVSLTFFGTSINAITADVAKKVFNAYPLDQGFGISHQAFNTKTGYFEKDGFSLNAAQDFESQFLNHKFDRIYETKGGSDFFTGPESSYLGAGLLVAEQDFLTRSGYKMTAGRLPNNETELCITKLMFQYFQRTTFPGEIRKNNLQYEEVIGKTLNFKAKYFPSNQIKIVGIIDTYFDFEKYDLTWETDLEHSQKEWDELEYLKKLLSVTLQDSYHSLFYVTKTFIDNNYFDFSKLLVTELFEKEVGRGAISTTQLQQMGGSVFRFGRDLPLISNELLIPFSLLLQYLKSIDGTFSPEMTDQEILESVKSNKPLLETFRQQCLLWFPDGSSNQFAIAGVWYDGKHVDGQWQQQFDLNAVVVQDANMPFLYKSVNFNPISALYTFLTGNEYYDLPLLRLLLKSNEGQQERLMIQGSLSTDISKLNFSNSSLSFFGKYLGIVFLAFTALMMANFISATIAAKRKEIGVMRALGAPNRVVFGIFVTESFITAIIAFLLATGTMAVLFNTVNMLNSNYILDTHSIEFNVWGILITFVTAGLVAVLGCLFPFLKFARKKPMQIIKS